MAEAYKGVGIMVVEEVEEVGPVVVEVLAGKGGFIQDEAAAAAAPVVVLGVEEKG